MIAACVEAYSLTRDTTWHWAARRCFERFLGRNDLGQPLFDAFAYFSNSIRGLGFSR
jgi:hypothetical protein